MNRKMLLMFVPIIGSASFAGVINEPAILSAVTYVNYCKVYTAVRFINDPEVIKGSGYCSVDPSTFGSLSLQFHLQSGSWGADTGVDLSNPKDMVFVRTGVDTGDFKFSLDPVPGMPRTAIKGTWTMTQGSFGGHPFSENVITVPPLTDNNPSTTTTIPASKPHSVLRLVINTKSIRPAKLGQKYVARLVVLGGFPPYKWRRIGGKMPVGLRLYVDGLIVGKPLILQRQRIAVEVTDSRKDRATRIIVITVVGKSMSL